VRFGNKEIDQENGCWSTTPAWNPKQPCFLMDGNGEFYQFFDGKDLVHHPIESLGFQVLLRRIPENPLIARFDSVTF